MLNEENQVINQEASSPKTTTSNEALRPVEAVYDIPVTVSAVLGSAKMPVSDLLKLSRGAVVELERRVGDPIDIFVNNRLVAKGEVVSVDEKLAITLTDVVKILK